MRIRMGINSASISKRSKTPINLKQGLMDPTLFSLILSNLITIGFALALNLDIMTILWVYWSQSVIIGLFNFFRILSLKNFSSRGLKVNGRGVELVD